MRILGVDANGRPGPLITVNWSGTPPGRARPEHRVRWQHDGMPVPGDSREILATDAVLATAVVAGTTRLFRQR